MELSSLEKNLLLLSGALIFAVWAYRSFVSPIDYSGSN